MAAGRRAAGRRAVGRMAVGRSPLAGIRRRLPAVACIGPVCIQRLRVRNT